MISVIIPTYNRKELLLQAATSVLSQICQDIELIIVDDGSTDGTEEGIEVYLNDPRVVYKKIEHTGFPGAVRNAGAETANGEWLAFLDSDDIWLPDKLKLQMEYLNKAPCSVQCIHGREIWLRGERIISQTSQRHARSGDIFSDALKRCIIGPSTVLIRRELFYALKGFRDDIEIAEDYELWLRLTAVEEVGYVDVPVTVKRSIQGSHQLSEKYGQIEVFRIRCLRDLLDADWFKGMERKAEQAAAELVRKCSIYARGARKRGKEKEAETYDQISRQYR